MPSDATKPAADPTKALLAKYEAAEDTDSLSAEERAKTTAGADSSAASGGDLSAPAAPAVAPSTPASVAAEDPPKHPAYLMRKAKKLGIDEDDLHEMSTEELRDEIAERRSAEQAQGIAKAVLNAAGQPYDPATGRLLPRNTPTGTPASDAVAAGQTDGLKLGMTSAEVEAAGYGPELHGVIERMVKPLVDEVARLKADNTELVRSERGRRFKDDLTVMDRWFGKHPDLYGSGALDEMDPDSREFKARMRVVKDMQSIPAQQRSRTAKEDFDKTHAELVALVGERAAPKPAAEAKPAETNGHVNRIGDKLAGAGTVRPSESQPPPKRPKGYAAAVAGVEALIKERASSPDADAPEEDDLAD